MFSFSCNINIFLEEIDCPSCHSLFSVVLVLVGEARL